MDVLTDWYQSFFEGDWLDQVATGWKLDTPSERAIQQTEFLIERLELGEGARVLDLACGHGRIALELARRGYHVTGLDLSPRSLQLAREAATREGLDVEWIEADMRKIPAGPGYDAIVNVFTAFGYFDDERENQRVLDGAAAALAPGGRFLIDVLNLLGLAGRYSHRVWSQHDNGVLQLDEHEFDFLTGRNRARWAFIRPDGTRSELAHSVRCYTPHELATMLQHAGLTIEGAWGGWDGTPLSFDARRLILLARKPA